MAMVAGKAVINIYPSMSNFKTSVNKELDNVGASATKTSSKVGSAIKATVAAVATAAVAAGALAIKAAKASIAAYNEQKEALAKLEQVASNQNWAKTATKDLMAYNAELQKVGIIGDEVTAAGQAQLGTFALSADSVKKLTPALTDLIAATKGYGATTDDSVNMANLLGKAVTGNVGALTRYGVTLTDAQKQLIKTGTEEERIAAITEAIAANYGGFNEKLAQTPQGVIEQLKNNFSDLQEQIGGLLAGDEAFSAETLTEQTRTVVANAVNVVKTFTPVAIEGGKAIAQGIVQGIKDELVAQFPSIGNSMGGLTDSLKNLGVAGSAALLPFLKHIPMIGSAFGAVGAPVAVIVGALALVFANSEQLRASFGGLITALMPALQELATALMPIFSIVGELAGMIGDTLAPIIQQLTPIIVQIVQFISQLVVQLTPLLQIIVQVAGQLLQAILPVVQSLITSLQPILQIVMSLITNLVSALMPAITAILQAAVPIIQIIAQIVGSIISTLMPVLEVIISVVAKIIEFVVSVVSTVVSAVAQIVGGIAGFIADVQGKFQGFKDKVSQIFTAIKDWIVSKFTAVKNTLSGIVNNIVNFFTGLKDKIWDKIRNIVNIGGDIVSGIVNGIRNSIGSIVDTLWGGVSDAIDTVTNWLGINSPSKLMRDLIGKNIMLGIGAGITMETGSVADSFQTALDDALAYNQPVNYTGTLGVGAGARAGVNVVNQTVNLYETNPAAVAQVLEARQNAALGV